MNYCITCKSRTELGYCRNDNLAENHGYFYGKEDSMLIYDFTEGGGFKVGEKFGCVHHSANAIEEVPIETPQEDFHVDYEGNPILDENGNTIPKSICLCHAYKPSECVCGAWDDVTDWDYD